MFRRKKTADIELLNSGYRYALSLAGNQQDAEDLVHDAWIRLDKRYGQCTEKALLFRTIRNLYIDQYRRRQIIHFVDDSEQSMLSSMPDAGAHSEIEKNYIAAEEMQFALERLRDVERENLYLSIVEGYTADEIAKMTGTSRGTVLSLLHRSKGKLRKILRPHDDAGTSSGGNTPGNASNEAGKSPQKSVPGDQQQVDNNNVVELIPVRTR